MTPLTSTAYTAEVTADAGRDGSVRSPDGVLDLPLGRLPGMGGKEGDGRTNPEQLFAAGYAACFHSALLFIARQENIALHRILRRREGVHRRRRGRRVRPGRDPPGRSARRGRLTTRSPWSARPT